MCVKKQAAFSLRFVNLFVEVSRVCAAAATMRMRKRKAVTERHERAYKGNLMALLATSLAKGVCLVFTLMKFRNCLYLILNCNKQLRFPVFWLNT